MPVRKIECRSTEALAHALATGWPSGGVLSAEAGAVFGAHGMGQHTILRNLALLNVLWDSGEMAINPALLVDRK